MAAKRPASAAPGVAEAIGYAEAVVAARMPAGRLARLACERFLRDRAAADAGAGPWGFEPDLVEAALLFAGQMPNIKGPEAGRPLRLMPWQKLVFANLFGFVERGTTTRRFRQAVVYVPRGNGKDRKSTRLNSSHANISYAVFCLKKKQIRTKTQRK